MKVTIKEHHGIKVVRDDLLLGGTKAVLMPHIVKDADEYAYASTAFGGLQIALAAHCQKVGKRATIFCAKRNELYINTRIAQSYGAKIMEVPDGMLTVVEKRTRDYCAKTGAVKIAFGGGTPELEAVLIKRVQQAIKQLGHEPKEIWCAIGSGTMFNAILKATKKSIIHGVRVGARFDSDDKRARLYSYHRGFDKVSRFEAEFPSMANYDLKALEYCLRDGARKDVLFWNVAGLK